jgi:hypothetical protein
MLKKKHQHFDISIWRLENVVLGKQSQFNRKNSIKVIYLKKFRWVKISWNSNEWDIAKRKT